MCGIFSLLNVNKPTEEPLMSEIDKQFQKGKKRGPEYSKLEHKDNNLILGFHRLAINGLNEISNQPIEYKGISLICNGEIYNYKQLYNYMNVIPFTNSDCEVIIHLYIKYGIEQTLLMLDGVFSFILYDNSETSVVKNTLYVARDPLGIRPLYILHEPKQQKKFYNQYIGLASELKCLEYFYNDLGLGKLGYNIEQFEPGTYSTYTFELDNDHYWKPTICNKKYYIPIFSYSIITSDIHKTRLEIQNNISYYLNSAIIKRCSTTERPVACLLSGGLDSSLIAALVADYFREKGQIIETYSIGLAESEDIKYAKIVADYIGSKHTEVIVTEEDMCKAIPEVIKAIESYDTTTVRASIGNYLIGKYISEHSEAKVIFNGDGSDELFGGYLYMNKCPDDIEFDKETRRLLKDIHLFDVLRSDKSISSNGLEPRTPFLDKTFVNYVLSIPPYFRNHNNVKQSEKYLLRSSFKHLFYEDYLGRQVLPDKILFRKKEAFSDGVSSQGRPLYKILQDYCANELNKQKLQYKENERIIFQPDIFAEKIYYQSIFAEEFPNCQHIVPYFWMPKYTNATDPSARTLDVYSDSFNNN